jgi:8-oxo-dGTP pyrophosphatase MutT (NUDIX family)
MLRPLSLIQCNDDARQKQRFTTKLRQVNLHSKSTDSSHYGYFLATFRPACLLGRASSCGYFPHWDLFLQNKSTRVLQSPSIPADYGIKTAKIFFPEPTTPRQPETTVFHGDTRRRQFMIEEHTHCSYCGGKFGAALPWPKTCPACHKTSYRNPLPVVVTLLPIGAGLVVIRRNIEPCKGTLTLPGGYLDVGESWQEGARRELWEETGIAIAASEMTLYDVQNGLDDTLVIFGLSTPQPREVLKPFHSAETQEVVLIEAPIELGFTMHTRVVTRYFADLRR